MSSAKVEASEPSGQASQSKNAAPLDQPSRSSFSKRTSGELTFATTTSCTNELTVCDITGDWGPYQWSLCLFALSYSTLSAFVVMFGPMLMPDIPFTCQDNVANGTTTTTAAAASTFVYKQMSAQLASAATQAANVSIEKSSNSQAAMLAHLSQDAPEFCFVKMKNGDEAAAAAAAVETSTSTNMRDLNGIKCTRFVYDDQDYGLMLTNGFDLVCDRLWLRSLITSSALVGMLFSSVSMGVFSDKFGRVRCVQVAFVISLLANMASLFVQSYYLFNVCIMLMCYAQIGAANALCTLVMEATSPRFRYVAAFEYSFGWAIGMALLPPMNWITHDFRWLMGLLLAWQLVMLPWLHWGVFESIRWLLSEGHLNRAQIELRRACRMNRIATDGALAQRIAQMQAQQVRKASRIIEQETLGARVDDERAVAAAPPRTELDSLSAALKHCLIGHNGNAHQLQEEACQSASRGQQQATDNSTNGCNELAPGLRLSPSLARASFSLHTADPAGYKGAVPQNQPHKTPSLLSVNNSLTLAPGEEDNVLRKHSITTQGLIQLAMKHSKSVQQRDAGRCFFVQMFHKKLWAQSSILLLISVMFETSYYGLLQANKFVGSSVDLNYLMGAVGETMAALATCGMLAFCSRRFSIVSCMLVGSLICLALALSYHLVPDAHLVPGKQGAAALTWPAAETPPFESGGSMPTEQNQTNKGDTSFSGELLPEVADIITPPGNNNTKHLYVHSDEEQRMIELRNEINFYLMNAGKFFISVGIQVAGIVAMEVYPNNLRQTGPGVILFAGRIGSIVAPFLFNDPTPERLTFKLTLVTLGAIGLLVCVLVPFFLRNTKDKDLCDQLDEIK